MKLKKFFAGVVAAAMMLTMGATAAFATEPSDMTTVTVTKHYEIAGSGTTAAETFNLQQTGKRVVDGDATEAPDLGTITGASFAAISASADGSITIALPEYTKVGVYEYTLQEVSNNTAGVTYFGGTIKLVVSVVNAGNGTVRVAAVHTEGYDSDGNYLGSKSDTFTNTYTANVITVSKTVTGNLGDKTKGFDFTIEFEKAEGENAPTGITYTVDDETKTVTFGEDGKAKVEFTLTDGQTLNFVNVPKGVKYTVTEDSYADDGYTTKLNDVVGNTSGVQTMTAEAASYAFVNNKGGEIDTGVILDNAPYIALLAIVAFGGVALVLNKRRRDEE